MCKHISVLQLAKHNLTGLKQQKHFLVNNVRKPQQLRVSRDITFATDTHSKI